MTYHFRTDRQIYTLSPGVTWKVEALTIAALIGVLNKRLPGIREYLTDEAGSMRKHVQIFVNDEPINDRKSLTDPLKPEDHVFIVQALSGG